MRVLIDGTPLRSGGGVQCAIALLEGLRAQRAVEWQAVIPEMLVPAAPKLFTSEAVADGQVIVLPKASRFDIVRASRSLREIERSFKPDVVYTVFGPAYFRAKAPHLVGFALPNLIYERDGSLADTSIRTRIGDAVRRSLIRRADYHVVETHTVANKLADRLKIPKQRISIIGNSVNPLLPDRLTSVGEGGCKVVLIPSSYYKHKNLEIIPLVAAEMANSHPSIEVRFHFTLDAKSADWQRILISADSLGVGQKIATLGVLSLDDLAIAYGASSMVLLPTLREASTAVYPESFHFERPLITSDLDFARDLCGEAALFVPPMNPQVIAEAIASLATKPERGKCLIAAGRQQLAAAYPTPSRKFEMQLDLLHKVSMGTQIGH